MIVVVCIATRYFIIPLVPILLLFYFLQRYYRRTSRELKRVDNISKSPIFVNLGSTLEGADTIRAFKTEEDFKAKQQDFVNSNFIAYVTFNSTHWWLSERLDFLGGLTSFLVGIFVVYFKDELEAGAVSYFVFLTTSLSRLIYFFATQIHRTCRSLLELLSWHHPKVKLVYSY